MTSIPWVTQMQPTLVINLSDLINMARTQVLDQWRFVLPQASRADQHGVVVSEFAAQILKKLPIGTAALIVVSGGELHCFSRFAVSWVSTSARSPAALP